MPFLIELWNSQHGMVWDRLTGTGLGWMRRPTFKCSQYTAPTFPIQLQYGTFGTGVATAQKFAQVWLQAGYDQKKCGNCCTSFPKIHCGSRWFWVLLENKKLQGSVVMSVSTTTQEYNCFDKHLNTSLLRKLWQPWLLGKPHWNSCCAPNHPGKGLDPPSNQANAHLILANSSLKKCPKPSGQGLRPPPPYGQCPNAPSMNLRKASLTREDCSTGSFSQKMSPQNTLIEILSITNGQLSSIRKGHIPIQWGDIFQKMQCQNCSGTSFGVWNLRGTMSLFHIF